MPKKLDHRIILEILPSLFDSQIETEDKLDKWALKVSGQTWKDLFTRVHETFTPNLSWGSSNIPALWSGAGLYHPATRLESINSWMNAREVETHISYGLAEPDSRIYTLWALYGRLLGYQEIDVSSQKSIAEYFRDWLDLHWTLDKLAMVMTPEGPRSLRCGPRSQGMYNRTQTDYLLSRAIDLQWKWRKGKVLPDKSWPRQDPCLNLISTSLIRDSAKRVRECGEDYDRLVNGAPKFPGKWPCLYMRCEDGSVAVWRDWNRDPRGDDVPNSNTPGIAAMGWDREKGEFWSLPRAGSAGHVRQKTVIEAVTTLYDGIKPVGLSYWQSGATKEPIEDFRELSQGKVIYLVEHGPEGLKRII